MISRRAGWFVPGIVGKMDDTFSLIEILMKVKTYFSKPTGPYFPIIYNIKVRISYSEKIQKAGHSEISWKGH